MSGFAVRSPGDALPVIWPEGLDFGPVDRDWATLVRVCGPRRIRRAHQEAMRLETLTRLAWGAWPLLYFLQNAEFVGQTPLGDLVQSTADWIARHYPWRDMNLYPDNSSAALTRAVIPLPRTSGAEATPPTAGGRSPESGPSGPDSSGGGGNADPDRPGPVGSQER